MNLIEQANEIIDSGTLTDYEITQLQRIKWKMTMLYNEMTNNAGYKEQMYNKMRANTYIGVVQKAKQEGKKYTQAEAEAISKKKSEDEYWDWRDWKAKCTGMKAVMDSIKDICVDYYTVQKNKLDI